MKKLIYLMLILFSFSTVFVYAEDLETTDIEDRDEFINQFEEQFNKIKEQRTTINTLRVENNALVGQLKTKYKDANKDELAKKLEEIKTLRTSYKDIVATSKTLVEENKGLIDQLRNAQGADKTSLANKRSENVSKLYNNKTQLTSNKAQIDKLVEELKLYREQYKEKIATLKEGYQRVSTFNAEVKTLVEYKKTKWTEFKSALENKDYTPALQLIDEVIKTNDEIIAKLNERKEALNKLISEY